MEIGKRLYVTTREEWRAWLEEHHASEQEIWLVYYKKGSGKPRVAYSDAVEEALCFGWIDSTLKPIDDTRYAQRYSPRRPKSGLSELNRERVRRMVAQGKMTAHGLEKIRHHLDKKKPLPKKYVPPKDILDALREDPHTWNHFRKFPQHYRDIRIAWVDAVRHKPEKFAQRLRYLLKMTKANKKYGMIP